MHATDCYHTLNIYQVCHYVGRCVKPVVKSQMDSINGNGISQFSCCSAKFSVSFLLSYGPQQLRDELIQQCECKF